MRLLFPRNRQANKHTNTFSRRHECRGKTEHGCPIITFPDIGNFSTLGDLEYQRLMVYLTSVPSMQEADIGFVLVIDRRNDRWNSVKPTLLKLSGYFPGLVHAVYVLRPSGIIKKTISDVLNKLFKEDFKFKVIVCNSLEELHSYIDKSQLTSDLGGSIQYNHSEWIRQREDLEIFSEEMKQVSNELDNFTKKMKETEIPKQAEAVQELLTLHQKEYGDLKEKLRNAVKHGETLLEIFRKSQNSTTVNDVNAQDGNQNDKFGNVSAVERLIVQLEETEKTFCSFQTDHFTKLKQWLDRRIFEQDVTELEIKFDECLKIVNDMVEVGESVSRVDELIKETNAFHKICKINIDRGEEVISNGQRLIKSKLYSSEETLQPDCDKIKKLCTLLTERLDYRLDTLKKHRELQEQIDKANSWCARGIELLSNQQIEKAAGDAELIQKSITEINLFLNTSENLRLNSPKRLFKDNIITPETKALVTQVVQRIADVTSMCDKRLASLHLLTANRQRPVQTVTPEPGVPLQPSHGAPILNKPKILRKANTIAKLEDPWNQSKINQCIDKDIPTQDPQILKSKRQHILAELLETEQIYVNELQSIIKGYKREMESPEMKPLIPPELIGKGDVLFGNLEEIYAFHNDIFLKDLQNCISTTELVALCFTHRKNEFYKLYSCYCQNSPKSEQLRELIGERNFFFGACQIKLGHKLPLAAYLLKPIQRITKYQLLLKDLLRSTEIPKCRNQLQEALKCMLVVLKCVNDSMHQIAITGFRGDLSDQGELLMQGSFSIWTESKKIRELRLTPMQRHIFLYRKAILFCKKENKENNKATYHFKRFLQMSQIGLTESVKGDPRKFEIWLQGRQQVHTIQASTIEQKMAWVQQIKEVLLEQLAELRGANMRQYSQTKTPILHRALRQTTSWESQSSMDSSAGNNNRAFSCDETNSHIQTLIESEEESSDLSNSDDENQSFGDQILGGRYVVLADYRSQGHNEISLQEGSLVEVLKVGCGGWWYIKLLDYYFQGQPIEGWAPSAYLEVCNKKNKTQKNNVSNDDVIVT
ncbi:Guanine nucleotide exchange factor DBS, putative [Pediculus humanus corporis]|uniref:Guanine nucleotide exchange factor DBS, putative n=1 Tax=Pediculus humanus subsp. corporis TaxID=121224 RepID=E0VRY6_PEDHC|nr:Guanine nucleotide exchange factor DBS, putative [Pediculus humanus corporis]EEB16142.1 Guanine nucleotide exchange factor DBS, putative [Pediculus humanus corporis]